MSKLKYVLLVGVAVACGVAFYLSGLGHVTIIKVGNIFSKIKMWFENLAVPVKTIITGSVPTAGLSLALKAIYDKGKKKEQVATNLIQDLRSDLTTENQFKQAAMAQVKTVEEQSQKLQANLTSMQKTALEQKTYYENLLAEKDKELERLRSERNEAERILASITKDKEEKLLVP